MSSFFILIYPLQQTYTQHNYFLFYKTQYLKKKSRIVLKGYKYEN